MANPAIVQKTYINNSSAATTGAATFASPVTAGNLLLAVGVCAFAQTISTVHDSVNAANYTVQEALLADSSSTFKQAVYVLTSTLSGTPTVTVTFSASTAFNEVRIYEISGAGTIASAHFNPAFNTAVSGSVTASSASDLLLACVAYQTGGPNAAPSGWTIALFTTSFADEDDTRTSPGSGSQTFTNTITSQSWVLQLLAVAPGVATIVPTVSANPKIFAP